VEKVKKFKSLKGLKNESSVDKNGCLLVGAAVGVGPDLFGRIKALLKAGADVICLDSAHGHACYIIEATQSIKKKYPQVELISGNVGNAQGFENLVKAGASAVRVGVGPGSICTTRIVSGVGAPQLSAIMDCAKVSRTYGVGLIADGGIKQAGDIVKALAAGAWTVMIGSLFARVAEAPGRVVIIKGRKYKSYRGMGSVAAMKVGSASRYGQLSHAKRLVAEGVEGLVPYQGRLVDFVFQLMGGVKSGMEYVGAKNLAELYQRAEFVKITRSGLVESHPHDVLITNGGESYHC
jgi:IMP dehydrogenase